MEIPRIVYSVSDINNYVKNILTNDENLKYLFVKGEVSNFKSGQNGHLYFSLKDENSLISCVMFNTYAQKLKEKPKDGDEVTLCASISAYPSKGTYQLLVFYIEMVGEGAILVELEKLKKKLAKEGLFDESRKRNINIYPNAIGVIAAKNGAAIADIITNIKRRYPICDIYFFPSSVQGENAPKELLKAFLKAQEYDLDTLIIGRGGGASEDLSAFNDEKLVRAIATSKMPVIAAVGHEIDSTLVDFVADKRASTPTGAAELATVDQREIRLHLANSIEEMSDSIREILVDMEEDLDASKEDLNNSIKDYIEELSNELEHKKNQLELISPKNILNRGYSISLDENGNVISNINEIDIGQKIKTIVKDGTVESVVTDKKKGDM